jgi:hypothetical protein
MRGADYQAFQSAFDGRHQLPDTGAHVSIVPGYSCGRDLESETKSTQERRFLQEKTHVYLELVVRSTSWLLVLF